MISRFGCVIVPKGDADAEGYFKAIRVEDATEREYHLGDICAETSTDQGWISEQCKKVAAMRRVPKIMDSFKPI